MSSTRPSPRNNLAKENNNNIQPEANVSWRNIAITLITRADNPRMAYSKPILAGLCASDWPNTNAAGFVKSVYAEP
jgi:hypothetical protein